MHYFRKITQLLLLTCGALACQKESSRSPCLEPKSVALRIQVSQRVDTNTVDSALRSPVLTPIGGEGVLQYTEATAKLQLYPSPLADSCQYVLRTDTASALADTLSFGYGRQLRYISDACGYGYIYNLLSARATGNFIDSVRIRNAAITSDVNSPVHVQIYLRR